MKTPNNTNTLLTLPINPLETSAMFGMMVNNPDLVDFDIGSAMSQVFLHFGNQLSEQGFIDGLGEGKITETDKEGKANFEIPVWGVMEVATAILALEKVAGHIEHLRHLLLWNPFMEKANRIMEFGETEESAGGESFLSMN
jgi:hypothetical protein